MKRAYWFCSVFLVVGPGLFACGCSGAGKVSGSVTLDGKPLEGAEVTFVQQGVQRPARLSARTDAAGKFELVPPRGAKEALKPGKYMVLIRRLVDQKGNSPSPEDYGQKEAEGKLKDQFNGKYNDEAFAKFTVEIASGSNDLKPFDIQSK